MAIQRVCLTHRLVLRVDVRVLGSSIAAFLDSQPFRVGHLPLIEVFHERLVDQGIILGVAILFLLGVDGKGLEPR